MENPVTPLPEKSIHPNMEYSMQLCFTILKRILCNLKTRGFGE